MLLSLQEDWLRMEHGLVWREGQAWSRGLREFVATLRAVQAETDLG